MTREWPPDPLSWHPAHRNPDTVGVLWDWLADDTNHLKVPGPGFRVRLDTDFGPATITEEMQTIRFRKRLCVAPAPWTGQPYVWRWPVGIDQYGRCVAGESTPWTPHA